MKTREQLIEELKYCSTKLDNTLVEQMADIVVEACEEVVPGFDLLNIDHPYEANTHAQGWNELRDIVLENLKKLKSK